ncbi:MAG TPA: hypothetical protein P5191_08875 [Ruminococcus sp.]|nr:hypothetical protein [Ruminococcus sp.]
MEFFAVLAVVIVLCIVLGVSADVMIMGAVGLVAFIIFAMTILFIFFAGRLLRSHRTEAVFLRVDKPEGQRFRCAYYEAGGREYPCVFPSEPSIMYREGKRCMVFLHTASGKVFDRFAATTCMLGLALSLVISAGIIYLGIVFFR